MSDEEFKAPDWISDNKNQGMREPTKRERKYLTIFLIFFIPFTLWAGWFEFGRAQQGNWRAWVYTFEWPFIAAAALYFYFKYARGAKLKIPQPDIEKLNRLADEDEKRAK